MRYHFIKFTTAVCILFFIIQFGCHKDKVADTDAYMLGYWQIEQYTLNSMDTTNYMKADSSCFSKLWFNRRSDGEQVFETKPFYTITDSIFNCSQFGFWFFTGNALVLTLDFPYDNIGPVFINQTITWNVQSKSDNELVLQTQWIGQNCVLKLKRIL